MRGYPTEEETVEPQNREQRRHPETLEESHEQSDPPKVPQDDMRGADRVQDDLSVRAKNSGHGKKTADKWNQ
jgi:hypothetical protein